MKKDKVGYEVGCVLSSDKVGVRNPVLVFAVTPDGKFKLADENNCELVSEFSEETLVKNGYEVMAKIDVSDVVIKPCAHKLKTVVTSSGGVEVTQIVKEKNTPDIPDKDAGQKAPEGDGSTKSDGTPEPTPDATPDATPPTTEKEGKKVRRAKKSEPKSEPKGDAGDPPTGDPPTGKEPSKEPSEDGDAVPFSGVTFDIAGLVKAMSTLEVGEYQLKLRNGKKNILTLPVFVIEKDKE